MYCLLKMGIFHCYVSLPEGILFFQWNLEMMVSKFEISFSKKGPFSGEPCLFWGVYFVFSDDYIIS